MCVYFPILCELLAPIQAKIEDFYFYDTTNSKILLTNLFMYYTYTVLCLAFINNYFVYH